MDHRIRGGDVGSDKRADGFVFAEVTKKIPQASIVFHADPEDEDVNEDEEPDTEDRG